MYLLCQIGRVQVIFTCRISHFLSTLLARALASHLSRFHAVETKVFGIIGISCDEAESLGLSLSHHRQVGGISVFYHLLSSLLSLQYIPPIFLQGTQGPPTTPIW